jgi:hypothetical protein
MKEGFKEKKMTKGKLNKNSRLYKELFEIVNNSCKLNFMALSTGSDAKFFEEF